LHDSDSFISEVTEEVRRDRFYAFLRRWGWLIAAILVIIVGGAAANEWRKYRAETAARATGDALRAAFAEQEPVTRAERLAALAAEGQAGALARLAQAGSLAQAGDTEAAGEVLSVLSTEAGVAEPYRALAALQRVMLMGADLDASERLATLQGLTAPGAPFRPIALEQRALVHLELGDREAAIADLEAVLETPGASEGSLARARQLIVAAGGALPIEGAGGAAQDASAAAPADG
jgi:hypothetical protein